MLRRACEIGKRLMGAIVGVSMIVYTAGPVVPEVRRYNKQECKWK